MLLKKLHSNRQINVNISKYIINWKKAPSKGQQELQDFLYKYWRYHVVCAELRIPGCLFRLDIVNITNHIILEYSPSHHFEFNEFFHKNKSNFGQSISRDFQKQEWAALNDFRLIEITEEDFPLEKDSFEKKFDLKL